MSKAGTVSEIVRILLQLEKKGYGDYSVCVSDEVLVDIDSNAKVNKEYKQVSLKALF